MLVDAPQERWFQEAAVNAVIAVFQAEPAAPEAQVCLARLRVSTQEAARVVAQGAAIEEVADCRFAAHSEPQTWAASLRAPEAWFAFASAAGRALTTLGEVAELRRGITSGANDIFYLSGAQASELSLPPAFLRPLMRASGKAGQSGIIVDSESCTQFALVVPPATDVAKYPALSRYLDSFEGAEARRTLASREPWWALQARPAQAFLSKAYAERFVQPYARAPMVADQRIYCAHPKGELSPLLLAAILNATPTSLALESLGRASMGEGALEWTVGDAKSLPILDPRQVKDSDAVIHAFQKLGHRTIGNVASEASQPDRQELDRAALASWPALVPLRQELQDALVQTCAARQRRAKA
jgi:hypothetical protein